MLMPSSVISSSVTRGLRHSRCGQTRDSSWSSKRSCTRVSRPECGTPPITIRRLGAWLASPRPSDAPSDRPRPWRIWPSWSWPPRLGWTTGSSSGISRWTPSAAKCVERVEDYAGERDAWFRDWFEPTWRRIEVRSLSWEDLIDVVAFHSMSDGQIIDSFYGQCLRFNRPQSRGLLPRAPFPVRPRAASCPRLPEWSGVS